ncbi:MAG: hypothetical protein K0R50_440 [Eubacterium sp.]|jgi:hypothetical protein|nr:hypothetical protein [Eubacterium sp.]
MIYRTCIYCGANLDPNETCDCAKKEAAPQQREQPPSKTTTLSLSAPKRAVKQGGHADGR